MANRDFEFRQLLRAYRAGIITEETFEREVSALGNGASANGAGRGFVAMGQTFASERDAIAAMLDRFRSGEANGEVAFAKWAEQCRTECIRSGLRMIAEREGYHARVFARRMRDLGLGCNAEVTEAGRRITERLSDATLSDNEKLLYLASLAPDPEAFFQPFCEFAESIKDDLETRELLTLYIQDELSSAKWLVRACEALNGPARPAPARVNSAAAFV